MPQFGRFDFKQNKSENSFMVNQLGSLIFEKCAILPGMLSNWSTFHNFCVAAF